jgi:hypothetical protein
VVAVSFGAGASAQRVPSLQRRSGTSGNIWAEAQVDPRARVDRLQLSIVLDPLQMRFRIERESAIQALSGLTAEQGRAVSAEYRDRTSWNLGWLISGELELNNSLGSADRKLLLNLLAGTVAPSSAEEAAVGEALDQRASDQQAKAAAAASRHRYAAGAAAIKAALDRGDADAALGMLRGPDRQALAEQYQLHFHEPLFDTLLTQLKGRDRERAQALWSGDLASADRLALEGDLERLQKAKDEAAKFESASMFADLADKLKQRTLEARAKLESRLEAMRAQPAGEAAAQEGRSHLQAVLAKAAGTSGPTVEKALASDPAFKALAYDDEPEVLAARLARADLEGSLRIEDIEAALRLLRKKAEAAAEAADFLRSLQDPAQAPGADADSSAISRNYYERFEARFDDVAKRSLSSVLAPLAADATVFDELRATGSEVERERNRALLAARGVLEPWQELDFALRRKPKDMDRVRRVLGGLTRSQVVTLGATYHKETDRNLEADLMGSPEQQMLERFKDADEATESEAEKRVLLQGGKFESNATDEAARLSEEGSWTFGRISALVSRVMENRGLFARARDYLGNIEHQLVARAWLDAVDAKSALSKALAETKPDLATARAQLAELRRTAVRLERNVGIYKEATEAAFNEFVDFAVLVISSAVTLGEGGVILMAIRSTAATIGTKLVLKGDDYSVEEFLGDLRGGVGAAAGGKLTEGLVKPLASRLAAFAQRKGLSASLSGKLAGAFEFEGGTVLGAAATNVTTGQDLTQGMGLTAQAQAIVQHHVTGAIKMALGGGRTAPEVGEQGAALPVRDPRLAPAEQELLTRTRGMRSDELPPSTLETELEVAQRLKRTPSTHPDYDEEIVLPNDHVWRRRRGGGWCRFSNGEACIIDPRSGVWHGVTEGQRAELNSLQRQGQVSFEDLETFAISRSRAPYPPSWGEMTALLRQLPPQEITRLAAMLHEHDLPLGSSAVRALRASLDAGMPVSDIIEGHLGERASAPPVAPATAPGMHELPVAAGGAPGRAPLYGEPLQRPVGPVARVEVGPADIAAYRERHPNLDADVDTIAVARTDVPGLEAIDLEGTSPVVRKSVGDAPVEIGPVESANQNPLFSGHAEEDIANRFIAAVEAANLPPSAMEGRTLAIHISNPTGVCSVCGAGLTNIDAAPGVLKQLSDRYPGLTIRITIDPPPSAPADQGSMIIVSGQRLW